MCVLTTAVIIVLSVWLGLSGLGQFDAPFITRIRARDHFSLMPRWTFFAPRPGVTDYHLLYQLFPDDWPNGWHEEHLADPRTVWGAIWNPLKRNKKALCDSVRSLGQQSKELDPSSLWQVQFSVPYLAALSYL